MGPSDLIDLPDKVNFILIGMFLLGFFAPTCFIQCLPEAYEAVQVKYQIIEGYNSKLDNLLSDLLSSMYTMFYSFSSLIGPIIGGIIYDGFGYKFTMNLFSFLMFVIFIVFLSFNSKFHLILSSEKKRKL